jgi:hypothetical protein
MAVVEGQPLPTAKGGGGLVERISLGTSTGMILDKTLAIEVAPSESGDAKKTFGLYPPSLYRGYFVYPRYLGFAPVIRFSAPDLPAYETRCALNIYPAGREDGVEIPNSPYRIVFSMAQPDDGSDPYVCSSHSIGICCGPVPVRKGAGERMRGCFMKPSIISNPTGTMVLGSLEMAHAQCRWRQERERMNYW